MGPLKPAVPHPKLFQENPHMSLITNRRTALLALGAVATIPMVARAPLALAQTGDEYVRLTLEGGKFLLDTSKMALEKTSSDTIREFAQLEIGEQEAVAAVLRSTGVEPPAELDGTEAETVARLMELSGEEFDAAYLDAQVTGHEEALSIQGEMAAMTEIDVPVATAKLATESIKTHLAMLEMIRAAAG